MPRGRAALAGKEAGVVEEGFIRHGGAAAEGISTQADEGIELPKEKKDQYWWRWTGWCRRVHKRRGCGIFPERGRRVRRGGD